MTMIPALTMGLLAFVSVILIFIVLLQRGRGGGLAGALGGAGGASAFGTKAGDVFTRITIVLAVIWVLLAAVNVVLLRNMRSNLFDGGAQAGNQATLSAPRRDGETGDDKPAPGNGSALSSDKGGASSGTDSKLPDTTASEATPATDAKPSEITEPVKNAVTPEAPKEKAKPEAPAPEAKPETPQPEVKPEAPKAEVKPETPKEQAKQPE